MKKYLFFLLALVFIPVALFSQVADSLVVVTDGEVLVIPDVNYLITNFGILMATYLGIAAIASFVGELLVRLFKMTGKVGKIVVVLLLGIGLSFLGSFINVGYLAEAPWYEAGLWGLLSGVTAAGLRGTNLLFFKSVIEFFIGLILLKEPEPEE